MGLNTQRKRRSKKMMEFIGNTKTHKYYYDDETDQIIRKWNYGN